MDTWVTLELVQIASPCHVAWESMSGDEHIRFCGECKLNVYNVAGMSREVAEQLINQREGRTCLRLVKREDGTVLTQDCPIGLRTIRRRLARLIAGTAALVTFLTFGGVFARSSSPVTGIGKGLQPLQRLMEWLDPQSPPASSRGFVMGRLASPIPSATSKPLVPLPNGGPQDETSR